MNIPLEEVESLLLQKKLDPSKVQEIVKDLEKIAEEIKEDRKSNAAPKEKFEYVIILNDVNDELKGKELTGWCVQQRSSQDSGLIISKLSDAAKSQNEAAKRKKNIIKTFGDLFECLKSKFAKEKGLRIKTKIPARVLVVNGTNLQ